MSEHSAEKFIVTVRIIKRQIWDGNRMKKIRIGILGAADIAKRRFLPALTKSEKFELAAVAVSSPERLEAAQKLTAEYGGSALCGYENMFAFDMADAVYIPLPPSLHYRWAKAAIESGKHVLLEKPSTVSAAETKELVKLAAERGVSLMENYGFCYHAQMQKVREIIESGILGEIKLARAAFGFPHRSMDDFRYKAQLGGGALLDCGGYTLKAMEQLFGHMEIKTSNLLYDEMHDVDMFGSATLQNESLTAQVSFGMDNAYKCELELWGSRGYLSAPRFFTPPTDFEAPLMIKIGMEEQRILVQPDDSFWHIIEKFGSSIDKIQVREENGKAMIHQMELVQSILDANPYQKKGE